jgi:cytochrome b561
MQSMHWGTVTLLLCTFAAAWMIDDMPKPADRAWLLMLHRSLGITLLLVTGLRLVIRYRTRIPPLPPGLPTAQRLAAKLSAISLYAALITQPVLGLAASILHGDRVVLFGGFVLPRLLPGDRRLAHALFEVHGAAAAAFLAVIGLHIAAALYHHFVRKDHVLASMLPGVSMTPRGR